MKDLIMLAEQKVNVISHDSVKVQIRIKDVERSGGEETNASSLTLSYLHPTERRLALMEQVIKGCKITNSESQGDDGITLRRQEGGDVWC